MSLFILGLVIFVGIHSVAIVAPAWRDARAARNAGMWKGIYSVVSVVGLVLLICGYAMARGSTPSLWAPPVFMRHIALLLMLPVFPLLIAAYFPGRISRSARHPMLVAITLWALAHLLANGSLISVILFGAFFLWAVLDWIAASKRPAQRLVPGAPSSPGNDARALVGGLAVYAIILLWAHRWLAGVSLLA